MTNFSSRSSRGAVAVFVKTPGLSPIKTRLAQTIGAAAAEEFHGLAARAIESVIRSAGSAGVPLDPYWAVAEDAGLNFSGWRGFATLAQGPGELGAKLSHVYNRLIERHAYVLLTGADSPQLCPSLFVRAHDHFKKNSRPSFLLGRSRDGGFYIFGGNVPVAPEVWREIPYSVGETAERLAERVSLLGPIEELSTLFDVDVYPDLQRLDDFWNSSKLPSEVAGALTPAQNELRTWIQAQLRRRMRDE